MKNRIILLSAFCATFFISCEQKAEKITVECCGEEKTLVVNDAYNQKYALEPLNFKLSYYSDTPFLPAEDGKGYGTYAEFAKRDGDKIIEQIRLNSWSATGMNAENMDEMMQTILSNSTGILEFNYELTDLKNSKKTIAGKEYWVVDVYATKKSADDGKEPQKYLVRNTIMAPSDTASRGLSVSQMAHSDSNVKTHDDFYTKACTALVVSSIDFNTQ